ncbi:MAG: hypothetical protein RLO51_28555 [Thalassobaculum sp.]|uniref:hypothetical protein n=1 Tax=Thalassobaculum sp. TaxID=2022740 RepID=UPI0032F0678E
MTGLRTALAVAVLGLAVAGCTSWATSNVRPVGAASATPAAAGHRPPAASEIVVTAGDFPNRPYDVLGDLEVTVNKTMVFFPDPTPADIDAKLREQAAAMGADAVILVKYGKVGLSWVSYGSLDGSGRAVRFRR